MGTISFLLPPDLPADLGRELAKACMAGGPDNMPWPTVAQHEAGQLILRRAVSESGYLAAPWDIDGFGRLMGSSATLMERTAPYQLQVELARGKINQVRCQIADWRAGGLRAVPALDEVVRTASSTFGAAFLQPGGGQVEAQAQKALTQGYQAAEQLVQAYIDQVFQIRHQRQPRLDTGLGCRLGLEVPQGPAGAALTQACNLVGLPFAWKDIEPSQGQYDWEPQDKLVGWAGDQELLVLAGPLLDFSANRLPEWLWAWEGDLANLALLMGRYVEAVVKRYRGRIRRWQLTRASNSASVLGLSEDEMLWLTVRLAEAAKQVDAGLELSVGIAQPWGEYMAQQERTHSPFLFADTLVRSGLNLAVLDLELVMGVSPRGSYCRDLLETSRLLDLYSLLGTAIQVTLGYPSASGPDPSADATLHVGGGHWRGGFTPAGQADWAAAFTTLVVSKPYVQSVLWVHAGDQEPHQFPHCGLIDAGGASKPALQRIAEVRQKHLR
jgi:hypothetical protein